MKKLIANVNVGGTWYGPGYRKNKVTAEVEKAITNPNVWGNVTKADDQDEDNDDLQEPPRSGSGSGVDVWKAHAEKLGLTVPANAKQADVIALVDAAKE